MACWYLTSLLMKSRGNLQWRQPRCTAELSAGGGGDLAVQLSPETAELGRLANRSGGAGVPGPARTVRLGPLVAAQQLQELGLRAEGCDLEQLAA
jgi:hypothetical protein